MKHLSLILLMVFSTTAGLQASPDDMTPERMIAIIEGVGKNVRLQNNVVEFTYESVPIVLVYDLQADRMRLISPANKVAELEPGQLETAMAANFHSALDARYAISNGVVWAAFIHPLSDLSPQLFKSAIRQVATASSTFGTTYSSSELIFSGASEK